MRVGLITTLGTNIGDDLIREGVVTLLRHHLAGGDLTLVPVNKHRPHTVYPVSHPIRWIPARSDLPRSVVRGRRRLVARLARGGRSRFDRCDLIVQCGAPVFWPGCAESEWAGPLWEDIVERLARSVPALNLAAGSCYPWNQRLEPLIGDADAAFIRRILETCRLTTVRDAVSERLLERLGRTVPRLPCTAFVSAMGQHAVMDDGGYVLLNFMPGGGHYDWGQGIDRERWASVMRACATSLGRRHRIAFLCHDAREVEAAGRLVPGARTFHPRTVAEYLLVVREAKFAICNRMHAAVAMAGLGIPSVAVCTDTRLHMVAELGLPIAFVDDVTAASLLETSETLLRDRHREQERLLALREATFARYLALIGAHVP